MEQPGCRAARDAGGQERAAWRRRRHGGTAAMFHCCRMRRSPLSQRCHGSDRSGFAVNSSEFGSSLLPLDAKFKISKLSHQIKSRSIKSRRNKKLMA